MKRKIIQILAALTLMAAPVMAQDYIAPQVVVSKEKVRSGGKVYYSHVVLERQTLYSISKAYGVSVRDICEANSALDLETRGLKAGDVLLVI